MKKNKILAIDFGENNVGLAVTDPGANLVFGKGLIKGGKSLNDLFSKIKKFCDDEEVNKIVFGLPLGKDGEETDQTGRMKKIAYKLKDYLGNIPLEFEDESFSSFEAREIAEGFEENKKTLMDYGIPKNKIKTIYTPYDVNTMLKKSNEELSSDYMKIFDNSFVFITIGRLDQPKGQGFLIRIFKEVVKKYDHAKLVILGDGPLENELKDMVLELRLEKKVFLLGVHQNIFPFIKNSNCFVFTSLWEGLGNVLIEALSLSIPIISTDCKYGPREILCPELSITQE